MSPNLSRPLPLILILAVLPLLAFPAEGQVTPADYEHAMGLRAEWEHLTADVADPVVWSGERTFHYRKTVLGGHEFVRFDVETLTREPAFDHERLAVAISDAAGVSATALRLPFNNFTYLDGGRTIQTGFAGSQWRCSLSSYACDRVQPSPPSGPQPRPRSFGVVRDMEVEADNTPLPSPDGRFEVFIRNHNLALRELDSDEVTMLSRDGSEGDFYELASAEWSVDSRMLAAFRVQPGHRRLVHYVEPLPHGLGSQPRHFTELYAKPGDRIDQEHPVLFHVPEGRQVDISNELFPNPYGLQALEWREDGRALTFEYNERGHQLYRVIEVDPATGAARSLVTERVETFFNHRPATGSLGGGGTRFRHDVDDGREIIWMSERDGWKHLYLYDGQTGEVVNQITSGEWVVRNVVRVDDEARQIWFQAGGLNPDQDPYFVHYYRVDFDGSNLTPLTHHADAYHEVRFSPDMEYYVDTYGRMDMPTVAELRRTSDGSLVTELERGDVGALEAAGWSAPEIFTAKGRDGETDIWGLIIRPTDFDPSRSYPVIENIYAGPHGSFVPKAFDLWGAHSSGDGFIGMQAMAEMGFIVVMIDGMGTSNRSKAFHDVAWKDVGDAGFPDRILWHEAVAETYPYYDVSRVGIYGGSAGGQNALGALLFHPDFYYAAVSFVGCHDNRMDKISWNEAWMGWPVDESYAASSNVDNAWRLEGEVLLVLGALDTNVDPASTMQVVDALIDAGKMFDLLVFPGDGHGAGRTTGPVDYGTKAQYDFFVRHLQGVEPPRWNGLASAREE